MEKQTRLTAGFSLLYSIRLPCLAVPDIGINQIQQSSFLIFFEEFKILESFKCPFIEFTVNAFPYQIIKGHLESISNFFNGFNGRYSLISLVLTDHLTGDSAFIRQVSLRPILSLSEISNYHACIKIHPVASMAVFKSGDQTNLCYIYSYDKRQRMVVKKLPGADSVLMVYDLRDRLVATQDGVQRAKSPKEWLFTKYDELSRPILTGTIQSANTRVQMQTAVNVYTGTNLYETRTTSSTHHYYTQNSFPNSSFTKTYLPVTYYDDYDVNNDGSGSGDPAYTTDSDFPNNTAFSRLKNQVTVSKARELDPASSSEVWFTTASFYDKRYRIIQTKTTEIQGGNNFVTYKVSFRGWLVKTKESQTVVRIKL